jgi:hypothetical protein
MTSSQEKYADKIDKLLRKAESTTPEEAEALIAAAQNLMTKYAIDEAMIEAARIARGEKASDAIVEEEFVMVSSFRVAFGNLCYSIIVNNNGKAVLIQDSPRTVDGKLYKQTYILKVTGFKSDIDRIRLLYTSLQLQAIRAERSWWKENKDRYLHHKRQGFLDRRQFYFSFASRVGERLREGRLAGEKAAAKEHGTGMELVLLDRKALVKAAYEAAYPNLRSVKSRQASGSLDSHLAGREAGGRADVGGQKLGGSKKALGR